MSLSFEHVTFTYDDFPALKDISFTLENGQIVGLIGENGAGKSTLIKNVVRFLTPDCGTISFDGKNILDVVENICDQYIIIKQGQLIANGTKDELQSLVELSPDDSDDFRILTLWLLIFPSPMPFSIICIFLPFQFCSPH